MTTPNIVKVVTYVYGVDFSLGADWIALKDSLGLSSVEQTYLIWLWLDTAYDMTYSRVQDGGNAQVGAISGIGANSFQDTMTTMMLELPMFTWASQFNISYAANVTSSGQTCESFYTMIGFPTAQMTGLCADSSNTFNFVYNATNNQGYFKSALALTSVYLYRNKFDTANAQYWSLFLKLTGWNSIQVT